MPKLKLILQASACVVAAAYSVAACCDSIVTYGKYLEGIEKNIRTISIYYTPYTDATFDSNDAMKQASLYKIQINCFINCSMYMKKIINQLSNATKVKCPSMMGSRYLLIEFKGNNLDSYINYLKWGNTIVHNNDCFHSKSSITSIVPGQNVFDRMIQNGNTR